jgi:hypothetical protein
MRGLVTTPFGAALALAATLHGAAAQTPSAAARPIHLEYTAPVGCPDASRFLEHVSARAGAVRAATSGESARTLRVTIRRAGARAEGELRTDEEPAPRRLEAPTCSAVVEGLGLVAAVMLEADDATPRNESSPPVERDAVPPADAVPVEETPSPRPGAGASFDVIGYAAPAAMFGGSVFGELAFGTTSPWQPSARLSFGAATTGSTALGSAAATFTLLAVRFEGCPLAPRIARISLHPCLHVELGAMAADGEARGDLVEPYTSRATWAGTGLDLRIRARLFSHLFAELEGGATLPLVKRSYVFDNPREVVYTTPPLALRSTIALVIAHP